MDNVVYYKFKYDHGPNGEIRLVSEKDIPVSILNEYHRRENLQDQSLVGSINNCCSKKELPCFNKTKTKGIIFS